jgi:alanine racemase
MISSTGVLTIDLNAIQSNWRYVSLLLKSAECAAVVKADAYGVGALEVAIALYATGCRTFFLATSEEASELRKSLAQDTNLFVLGGVKDGAESIFSHLNLIPVLYSPKDILRWIDFCDSQQVAYPCAIKIDTGMSRLGLSATEFQDFITHTAMQSWLNPVLLMSHLACADEPQHPLNISQLESFRIAIEKIKFFFPHIKTSLANSSGTFLDKKYHFDMVRIGAALYGINPQPTYSNPLSATIHLKLPVLQIRVVNAPAAVGYGAQEVVALGARLAVVAGGYADGIHRSLGLRPRGIVDGVTLSAVGRISMDTCIFDISKISSFPDYISVIDDVLTLDKLAHENKSLGYEVLTSLSRRFQRKYLLVKNNDNTPTS